MLNNSSLPITAAYLCSARLESQIWESADRNVLFNKYSQLLRSLPNPHQDLFLHAEFSLDATITFLLSQEPENQKLFFENHSMGIGLKKDVWWSPQYEVGIIFGTRLASEILVGIEQKRWVFLKNLLDKTFNLIEKQGFDPNINTWCFRPAIFTLIKHTAKLDFKVEELESSKIEEINYPKYFLLCLKKMLHLTNLCYLHYDNNILLPYVLEHHPTSCDILQCIALLNPNMSFEQRFGKEFMQSLSSPIKVPKLGFDFIIKNFNLTVADLEFVLKNHYVYIRNFSPNLNSNDNYFLRVELILSEILNQEPTWDNYRFIEDYQKEVWKDYEFPLMAWVNKHAKFLKCLHNFLCLKNKFETTSNFFEKLYAQVPHSSLYIAEYISSTLTRDLYDWLATQQDLCKHLYNHQILNVRQGDSTIFFTIYELHALKSTKNESKKEHSPLSVSVTQGNVYYLLLIMSVYNRRNYLDRMNYTYDKEEVLKKHMIDVALIFVRMKIDISPLQKYLNENYSLFYPRSLTNKMYHAVQAEMMQMSPPKLQDKPTKMLFSTPKVEDASTAIRPVKSEVGTPLRIVEDLFKNIPEVRNTFSFVEEEEDKGDNLNVGLLSQNKKTALHFE